MKQKNIVLPCVILLFQISTAFAQWNPSAGVVPSFTEKAMVTASSTSSGINNVLDNNFNTSWQSDAPLPNGFLNRADQNFIYQKGLSITSGTGTNYANLTDGNTNTATDFAYVNGKAKLVLTFAQASNLLSVSTKISANSSSAVQIFAFISTKDSVLIGTFNSSNNYTLQRYDFPKDKIIALKCYSNASFQVFELGIIATLPKEWVVIDLGSSKNIGQIETRHWSGGGASAASLYISNDKVNWVLAATLVHDALQPVISQLSPAQNARYIKVEHTLLLKDWNKVYVWEVDAFGVDGKYGAFPKALPSSIPFKKVLGVNGIWGWGNNAYSYSLGANQGPNLYNKAARHARNYHAMSWDVSDPDIKPDYVKMAAGGGTQGQPWLNWDKEYSEWVKAGLEVQACIQFLYPASAWDSVYQSAYNYGYAFAKHFGPTFGTGHIPVIEIGNEPWDYDSTLYRTILRGMAKGAKTADPAIKVLPCALQAGNPNSDIEANNRNYMGTRITADEAPYLDGINVHAYSYLYDNQGISKATYPENPLSDIRSVLPSIRFRDQNMPNKKVYWSEYGWDTGGANEPCTHNECVTEREGTAYAVRGALMGWRWGVERMSWFFYANDVNGSSLYTRSGLTGSKNGSFQKKAIFTALEALLFNIENTYFLGIQQEDDNAWIYILGDAAGNPTHYIAWKPIEGNSTTQSNVAITTSYSAISAVKLEGVNPKGETVTTPTYSNGKLNLTLGAIPIVVAIKKNGTNSADLNTEHLLHIYPNPTENECAIEHENGLKKIVLWDALGRNVYENNWISPKFSFQLSTSFLAKGLYICEILTSDNERICRKIVVE